MAAPVQSTPSRLMTPAVRDPFGSDTQVKCRRRRPEDMNNAEPGSHHRSGTIGKGRANVLPIGLRDSQKRSRSIADLLGHP